MSEIYRPPNEAVAAKNRAIALIGSVLTASGGLPAVVEANPPPPSRPEPTPTERIHAYGAENAPIPQSIQGLMRRDTVYMAGLRCSGKALRNKDGSIVGVLTAEHCSLRNQTAERITGSDGLTYIVQPQPIKAKVGAHYGSLRTVAEIESYIVPKTGDTSHDIAIGVARGHSPSEAMKVYRNNALTPAELQKLKAGRTVYMASWPEYQPRNPNRLIERQAFAMKLLGLGTTDVDTGKRLRVAWTSVESTADGASCTPGASGSEGFVMIKGKPRSIGAASVYLDLSGRQSLPLQNGSSPSLKEGNATTVCGFAYEQTPPGRGGMVIHAVRSAEQIPGYLTPEQTLANARAKFKDPSKPKTIIDGMISIAPPLARSNRQKGGPEQLWADGVALYHDKRMHRLVMEYADPQDPDHLAYEYYDDRHLQYITIYPRSGTNDVDLRQTTGTCRYQPEATGSSRGNFIDEAGLEFGGISNVNPDFNGPTFRLAIVNDHLEIYPNLK